MTGLCPKHGSLALLDVWPHLQAAAQKKQRKSAKKKNKQTKWLRDVFLVILCVCPACWPHTFATHGI